MQKWNFEELNLKGAYLITPFYNADNRGGFLKDYSQEVFKNININFSLKEVFYTISKKGVIRGIHFQNVKEQGKLVRCIKGKIYDVIVDLRLNSPTFKQWMGFILSEENMKELLVPRGFGHGYLVLEDSVVSYKCDEVFYGEFDDGIKFDDVDLKIDWNIEELNGCDIILSDKDENLQSFKEYLIKMGINNE